MVTSDNNNYTNGDSNDTLSRKHWTNFKLHICNNNNNTINNNIALSILSNLSQYSLYMI